MPADANVPAEVKGWKQSTGLLFHDVLVTAVQKAAPETEKNSGSASSSTSDGVAMPNGSAFITVARTDAEAAKLVYGAEFGTIWLAKQTETSTKSDPPVTTFGGLY
jgi:pilus assembly protein CpaB